MCIHGYKYIIKYIYIYIYMYIYKYTYTYMKYVALTLPLFYGA